MQAVPKSYEIGGFDKYAPVLAERAFFIRNKDKTCLTIPHEEMS